MEAYLLDLQLTGLFLFKGQRLIWQISLQIAVPFIEKSGANKLRPIQAIICKPNEKNGDRQKYLMALRYTTMQFQ